jgi:hypothetical protein
VFIHVCVNLALRSECNAWKDGGCAGVSESSLVLGQHHAKENNAVVVGVDAHVDIDHDTPRSPCTHMTAETGGWGGRPGPGYTFSYSRIFQQQNVRSF